MTARSLAASIRRRQTEGLLPVLSEIKVRSPKEGDLLRGRAPETLAAAMATAPIAGLSVVTEPADFGGDVDIVRRGRPPGRGPHLPPGLRRPPARRDPAARAPPP